jgi:hypothetical protein
VWARKAKRDSICGEKGSKVIINEFTTIITLDTLNKFVELCFDIGKEAMKCRSGVRFVMKRECPRVM